MKEGEMKRIADLIHQTLSVPGDPANLEKVRKGVEELTKRFPLYPELL